MLPGFETHELRGEDLVFVVVEGDVLGVVVGGCEYAVVGGWRLEGVGDDDDARG